MSYKSFRDYNEKHGAVAGFITAPTDYLNMIKEDLGLSMPLYTLSYLQNHYRIAERRDPLVEELIMLDILWANADARARKKRVLLLESLVTDDKDIKDSFADLMLKMRAIHPLRHGPIPFESLSGTAGEYLSSIFSYNVSAPSGEAEKVNIKDGSYIFISVSPEQAETLLTEMRTDTALKFSAKMIEHNMIEEVASEGPAEIHLSAPIPAFASFMGGLLIAVKDKNIGAICALSAEKGYPAYPIGRKLKKGKLSLFSPFLPMPISIEPALIRELTNIENREVISVNLAGNKAREFYDRGITAVRDATLGAREAGENVLIKNTVRFPIDSAPSDILALILGIYRAQIELCVCDTDSVFEIGDEVSEPEISVMPIPPRQEKIGA